MTAVRTTATLLFALFGITTFLGAIAFAQSPGMDTGWMELVKGHIDSELGAEVRQVDENPETGERSITIRIPKEALQDEAMMEEVMVIGQAPNKIELDLPTFETEWIDNYDSEYYGLLVRLKDGPETPIRLFFNAAGAGGAMDNGAQP